MNTRMSDNDDVDADDDDDDDEEEEEEAFISITTQDFLYSCLTLPWKYLLPGTFQLGTLPFAAVYLESENIKNACHTSSIPHVLLHICYLIL